jgi:3-deoxy-D-manno-octulosonate 8-phosphate phosphatase (KDO 8-P phosphatase)
MKADLRRRLRRVRALVLDVDGVLTDGGMVYGAAGQELKRFDTKDGMGLRLVQEAGIAVAFVTAEKTEIALRRAEKVKVADVHAGVEDKLAAFLSFLSSRGIEPADAAYMGDDVNDLAPLGRAGLAVAPADAVPAVRKAAHWVVSRPGGHGAVRELCDALLAARSAPR